MKARVKKGNSYAHIPEGSIVEVEASALDGELTPINNRAVISIDGVKGAFQAMAAGKMNVTVECSPLLGPLVMSTAKDIVAGKTVARRIIGKDGVYPMETAAKEFPSRQY